MIFYVANSNNKDALVNGFPDTPIINTLVLAFWAFAQSIGAWFWFEHVPANQNIADLPTRWAEHPHPSKVYLNINILNILKEWATLPRKKGVSIFHETNTGRLA